MQTKQSSLGYATLQNIITTLLLTFGLTGILCAQNINTGFGKNRVQYHHQQEDWQYYETPHFTTYWYGDARNIAVSALQMAEFDYDEIQRLLEYQLSERVEILVFSDITDLKQSNIGADALFLIKSGETKTDGNKIFIYYDGNHRHLRKSIREGLAGVIINAMLLGGNLQEIVQNSVLLNLPGWYTEGLKAYCGEEWSTETDQQLRNLLTTNTFNNFDKLAKQHPVLAGHAFWQYIAHHFGPSAVSNLLYLTRINRGLDAGFRYVMGNGYDRTTALIFEHYKKRYAEDAKDTGFSTHTSQVKIPNKKKLPIYQPKISPDGHKIAWVQNDIGKWKVRVKDLKTGKTQTMLRGGIRNALQATDYGYPLLSWSGNNQTLGVVFEQRDVPKLALIDVQSHKKEIKAVSPEFQRIHSIDFINPVDLVFSATVRGYTDIYIYHSVNRQTERITQDFWDDLDASFVRTGDHRYIAFASNRPTDSLSQQRLDTILPIGTTDLFLFDLETRSPELIRLTKTTLANERQPMAADSAHIAWISDENGISNRSVGYLEEYTAWNRTTFYLKSGAEVNAVNTQIPGEWPVEKALLIFAPADTVRKNLDSLQIDSVRTTPVFKKRAISWSSTCYPSGIQEADAAGGRSILFVESFKKGKETLFYLSKLENHPQTPISSPYTTYRKQTLKEAGIIIPESIRINNKDSINPSLVTQSTDSIPAGWGFQIPEYLTELSRTPTPPIEMEDEDIEEKELTRNDLAWNTKLLTRKNKYISAQKPSVLRFNPSKIIPYRLKFRTDFISTDMNNNLLFEGLDSYAGTPDGFSTPPPGVLLRANFKELLENYVIETGFRLPTTFNGSEYYLWLDKRKQRIDRRYTIYRKTIVHTLDGGNPGAPSQPYQVRTNTLLGQYEMRYPFDPFFSVRAMGTLRQDKSLTLTSDRATLETPDYTEQRAALRLSAVYDNTVDVDINLKTGSRARFYIEAVKRFEFNTQPNWSMKFNSGFMTVINLDARHYHKIDKHSILALRLAGATTFGSERILYYLGGVDNWVLPRFNDNIPVAQTENFAYQTLAAHLRGFRQNIRNGSSFALINSEIRIPVFKYFSKKPVLGNFWRNFQVVGFFDAGTAWTGSSPYDKNNPINIEYLENPPTVQVKVNYFRDPLVAGYGAGVRMQLFGLYLRGDYAWGIETRKRQKPMFHIALGADF